MANTKSRLILVDFIFTLKRTSVFHFVSTKASSILRILSHPPFSSPLPFSFCPRSCFPPRDLIRAHLSPLSCWGQPAGQVPVQGMPELAWPLMLLQRYLGAVLPARVVMLTFSKEKPEQGLEAEQWMAEAML